MYHIDQFLSVGPEFFFYFSVYKPLYYIFAKIEIKNKMRNWKFYLIFPPYPLPTVQMWKKSKTVKTQGLFLSILYIQCKICMFIISLLYMYSNVGGPSLYSLSMYG